MKKLRCISLPEFKRNLPSITLGKIYEKTEKRRERKEYKSQWCSFLEKKKMSE